MHRGLSQAGLVMTANYLASVRACAFPMIPEYPLPGSTSTVVVRSPTSRQLWAQLVCDYLATRWVATNSPLPIWFKLGGPNSLKHVPTFNECHRLSYASVTLRISS
ncbi:hypothetical protein B0H14DRAFT_2632992 [Mycena olivaceomarginata]|nr:hypothetical protein B0H14DRAFT_2632992 [Mycena olivaceomarginata]